MNREEGKYKFQRRKRITKNSSGKKRKAYKEEKNKEYLAHNTHIEIHPHIE